MKKQNKKPFIVVYDKYVANHHGGCDVERTTLVSPTKDLAVRRMKADVYNRGCNGGYGVAFMPNGDKMYFKPRKAPVVSIAEKTSSPVVNRTKHHSFGRD